MGDAIQKGIGMGKDIAKILSDLAAMKAAQTKSQAQIANTNRVQQMLNLNDQWLQGKLSADQADQAQRMGKGLSIDSEGHASFVGARVPTSDEYKTAVAQGLVSAKKTEAEATLTGTQAQPLYNRATGTATSPTPITDALTGSIPGATTPNQVPPLGGTQPTTTQPSTGTAGTVPNPAALPPPGSSIPGATSVGQVPPPTL